METISKERFTEIWDATIGPLFEDGTLTWECSPQLEKYLLAGEGPSALTDDEIAEMLALNIL